MNEVSKQQLSALFDGELAVDEARFLLSRIARDPGLADLWGRYQVIGDCMRHEGCVPADSAFSVRVMRQIQTQSGSARGHRVSRWVRYGLGGGIAASVAVAALVWMQPRSTLQQAPAAAQQARSSAAPAAMLADSATPNSGEAATLATGTPDYSALLRQPQNPLLSVQPASAVRGGPPILMSRSQGARPIWMRAPAPAASHQPETFYLRPVQPGRLGAADRGHARQAQPLTH